METISDKEDASAVSISMDVEERNASDPDLQTLVPPTEGAKNGDPPRLMITKMVRLKSVCNYITACLTCLLLILLLSNRP